MKIKIAPKALRVESEKKMAHQEEKWPPLFFHVLPHAFSHYITKECCESDHKKITGFRNGMF